MRPHRSLPLLPLLPFVCSCELTEVTVAPGQRVVVVQSVIDRTQRLQMVVVEYSETGDTPTEGGATARLPFPRIPIGSARVTIEHKGGACGGQVDTLPEGYAGTRSSGLYVGSVCPAQPRERLVLRVETPAGEVVTGTTTVPGTSARELTPRPLGFLISLDRERDTLRIGLTPAPGRALQIEARNEAHYRDLAFFAFTDTMGMSIPGNLVNPFEGDSGESLFRAGRDYRLAVAVTDSNYYDFLRSRSDPFTGRGFINHLDGGIGVFGSLETATYSLHVVAPIDDPREGTYRLVGTVDTLDVDATLELYLDEVQRGQFSAFVRGWPVGGGFFAGTLSGDGFFPQTPEGELDFHLEVPSGDSLPRARYQLTGTRQPAGAAFPVIVRAFFPPSRTSVVDTLTAQQISGPNGSERRYGRTLPSGEDALQPGGVGTGLGIGRYELDLAGPARPQP